MNRAAGCFDATPSNGEAEPVPIGSGASSAKERREQVGQFVFWDAAAVVEDTQCVLPLDRIDRRLDPNDAALRGMFERVADNVLYGAVQKLGAPLNRRRASIVPNDFSNSPTKRSMRAISSSMRAIMASS